VLGCCGLVQQQHEFRHDCSTCWWQTEDVIDDVNEDDDDVVDDMDDDQQCVM